VAIFVSHPTEQKVQNLNRTIPEDLKPAKIGANSYVANIYGKSLAYMVQHLAFIFRYIFETKQYDNMVLVEGISICAIARL